MVYVLWVWVCEGGGECATPLESSVTWIINWTLCTTLPPPQFLISFNLQLHFNYMISFYRTTHTSSIDVETLTAIMSLQLFNCEICGQEAMTEPDLRTHLRLEHEENEGSCPLCDLRHLTLEELHLHVNTAHSLVLSPHQKEKKADSKDAPCSSNENKETIDLVEEFVSVEGRCKTSPIETNERTIDYVSSNRVKQPRSCACHFENGTKLEPDVNGENNFDKHKKELPLCNLEKCSCLRFPSGSSDNNAAKSMSLPIVKDSSSVHVRKRTRSTAQWSSASSASNSVTNIDLFEEHSNRSKSTSSPFKKFLRMFSPNKSKQGKKKSDDDDVEEVQIVSCRSGSDGIWNEDQDDSVMSEPECPFCQISGLDLEAMEQHVEVEHSDAFINSSKTATMNGGHWNTSSTPNKSHPKPTLLSLSKHAHNLHSAVTCPICGLGSYDPDFLAVHINTEHPTPSTSEQTTSIPQNNSNEQHLSDEAGPSRGVETCPICGISASDVTSLNDHVDGHFESPESFTADRQLARQLDEQERQLQERRERETFKQLQVATDTPCHPLSYMYNMGLEDYFSISGQRLHLKVASFPPKATKLCRCWLSVSIRPIFKVVSNF